MIQRLSEVKDLKSTRILDVGCGQGVALREFLERGAKPIGIAMGDDVRACKQSGLSVYEMDLHEITFPDKSFDIIWCRHALEHSLAPLYTLAMLERLLRERGMLYVEVPAPDTSARHEFNANHYSCFSKRGWLGIFSKTKLKVKFEMDISLKLPCGPDTYYCFFLEAA